MATKEENRRAFERFEIDREIEYRKNDEIEPVKGILKNLNGTGMLIQSEHPAAPGDLLDISTLSTSESIAVIRASVKVKRCSANPGADGYQIAGAIISMNS